jgi:hypothetical protein
MRLLAFSDIHHNLTAVQRLRVLEKNSFDAIVVAGDMGSESAAGIFKILMTFECPIMYVYGNWDHKLGYKKSFGVNCHLIHCNVIAVGNINFTGFSGCPTNWGKNPIARRLYRRVETENKGVLEALRGGIRSTSRVRGTKAYRKYMSQLRTTRNEILKLNREGITKALKNAEIDPRNCVIITHQRLTRLSEEIPGTLLHLFGHLHAFSEHTFKSTKYVNVAALDRETYTRPRIFEKWENEDCRTLSAGNYTIIEIDSSRSVNVRCIELEHGNPN